MACWPIPGAYLDQWRRNINPGCLHCRGHPGGAGAGADCQSIKAAGNRRNLPQEGRQASATLTKVALVPLQASQGVGHAGRWLARKSRSNKRQPWGVWNSGGWEWGDIQGRPGVITGGDMFQGSNPWSSCGGPLSLFFSFSFVSRRRFPSMRRRLATGTTAAGKPETKARRRRDLFRKER